MNRRRRADKFDEDAAALRTSLRRGWPLRAGRTVPPGSLGLGNKTGTLAQARAEGYPAAAWTKTEAQVDAEQRQVALTLALDSGALPPRRDPHRGAGRDEHGAAPVHLRRWPALQRSCCSTTRSASELGLFDNATVELGPDPKTSAAAPVRVRVHELTSQQATVGVGISANTGPRVTLEHRHRRPFGMELGGDQQVRVRLADQVLDRQADLAPPLEGLYRNLLAGNAERLRSGEEIRTSWTARLGARGTRSASSAPTSPSSRGARRQPVGRTRSEALTANYHWIYRDLDSILLPTPTATPCRCRAPRASSRNSTLDTALRPWLPATHATRRLGRAWYASCLEAGQIYRLRCGGRADTLLFRAGGDSGARLRHRTLGLLGRRRGDLGPRDGHRRRDRATDLSFMLPGAVVGVFADAGNAANHWKMISCRPGAAMAGLRWRSLVGPAACRPRLWRVPGTPAA